MAKAMNLTLGDLIILEIALVHYLQNLDLAMTCGQVVTELIGKIEYQMAEIQGAMKKQFPTGLQPNPDEEDGPKET